MGFIQTVPPLFTMEIMDENFEAFVNRHVYINNRASDCSIEGHC
ncbi:hypothetical protein OROGR_019450 [Orobanche gracilis]